MQEFLEARSTQLLKIFGQARQRPHLKILNKSDLADPECH